MNDDQPVVIEGKGGSAISWLATVEDAGGEGNSHAYHISIRPQYPNGHVDGDAAWNFTLLGDWEVSDFPRVLRRFADLVEATAS